jgi:ABC-type branched-subunit amino acid transport system substrate-binding protein
MDEPVSRRDLLAKAGGLALGASLLGAAGAFAAPSAYARRAAGGGLKIGLLTPVTGPLASVGTLIQRGFDMGIAHVNAAGGILGKQVTVYHEDDQGSVAPATTAAKKLLQQDKVDVLFGTVAGDTTIVVNKVATQAHTPFMKTLLDDYVNSPLCSPYFFKLGESDYQLNKSLIPFLVAKFGKRVALVGNDYSFPHAYFKTSKALLAKAHARVVAEEYAPLGTTDYSSVIGKLKAAKADWILGCVVGGDAVTFLKQADSLGLDTQKISGVTQSPEWYGAVPKQEDGAYNAVRYTDRLTNGPSKAFVAAYRKKYKDKGPLASVTVNSYMGVLLLAKAVNAAGTSDGPKIASGLGKVSLTNTLYGPAKISFNPRNNLLDTNIYIVHIQPGGKLEIVRNAGTVADPSKC